MTKATDKNVAVELIAAQARREAQDIEDAVQELCQLLCNTDTPAFISQFKDVIEPKMERLRALLVALVAVK